MIFKIFEIILKLQKSSFIQFLFNILHKDRALIYNNFFKTFHTFFLRNWRKRTKRQNAKNDLEFYVPSIDSIQKLLQLMPIHILFLHCHELKSVHSPLGNTELSLGQRILLV